MENNKFLKKMNIKGNTQAWVMQVWASFALSIIFGAIAIFSLPTLNYERLVMAIAFLFTLSTTFTLAKTIRDNHEHEILEQNLAPKTFQV